VVAANRTIIKVFDVDTSLGRKQRTLFVMRYRVKARFTPIVCLRYISKLQARRNDSKEALHGNIDKLFGSIIFIFPGYAQT